MKKLYINEGIDASNDDVFRPVYMEKRAKVREILQSRPEVVEAIDSLLNNLD